MSKLFGHGDLRLYLLKLLEEEPRHGYDIISLLETRFLGLYSPSPGTIYPRLQALVEDGYLEVTDESGGRRVYRLTDAGREEIAERAEELRELGQRLARSAREIARDVKEEVRASVSDLRREIREAAKEVRRDERRTARDVADTPSGRPRRQVMVGVHVSRSDVGRELQAFLADVSAALKHRELDREQVAAVRRALREARALVIEALERKS